MSALRACLAVAVLVVGCGTASTAPPPRPSPQAPRASIPGGAPVHVAVIVMENESYQDVIGASSAPYISGLARRSAVAGRMYAIRHPSLPNYLALTGGSTFKITSDCTGCKVSASSLVDQLESAAISWKAYMEDLPHPCFMGTSKGGYAKKHDPFAYYTRITGDPARCGRIVPLRQLGDDERTASLPRFVWITPNLCHSMHDCSVRTGDRFLSRLVPPLLSALGPQGLLVLTWDEGGGDERCCRLASGGHIPAILAGPEAGRGVRNSAPVDHYSVLQTVEDLLGLTRLRDAACACTRSLQPLLATQRRAAR